MALRIQSRPYKKQDGTVSNRWRLIVEDWSDGRKCLYPAKSEYQRYGLDPKDPLELALEKLKTARANLKIKAEHAHRSKIEKRQKEETVTESAYLPGWLYSAFLQWLKDRRMWDEIPDKTQSHLRALREMVLQLGVDPSSWSDRPELVYRWFKKKAYSPSTIDKLMPLVNGYGYFYCKELKKPFLNIPSPRGETLRRLSDANIEARQGETNESLPITPGQLSKLDLDESQLRWMRLTVWFGLRPNEATSIGTGKAQWKVSTVQKLPVFNFYQSKLVTLDQKRRWKRIPCILKEQRDLLQEIQRGLPVARPYAKTIQAKLGHGHRLYGGRKGFEKLMRGRGQDFRNISRWLGHRDINRTETNYRETEAVEFDPVR